MRLFSLDPAMLPFYDSKIRKMIYNKKQFVIAAQTLFKRSVHTIVPPLSYLTLVTQKYDD